jgi:hypothetical protein
MFHFETLIDGGWRLGLKIPQASSLKYRLRRHNCPRIDDRLAGRGDYLKRMNRGSCGLLEAFYDKSMTYTKTQQLSAKRA